MDNKAGDILSGANMFERRTLIRLGLVLGGGVTLAGSLAACDSSTSSSPEGGSTGGPVKRGGILTFATDTLTTNESMDPSLSINDGIYLLQGCIREGVSWLDENQVPQPQLATWESNDDSTQWTLTVRPGVKFHDGTPLTAHDIEWMILRNLDPESSSSLTSRLAASLDPSGVKVLDDSTLQLNCKQPDSALMGPFGRVAAFIVPKGTTDFAAGMGTGAFKIKSYTPGQGFEVTANPDYWQADFPYLDGVRCLQVPDSATRVQGVLSGETHGTEVDYQSVPTVEGASNVTVYVAENAALLNLAMDQTQAPFTDVRVRQALKYCVDREKAIQVAYAGYGEVGADVPIAVSDPHYAPAFESRTAQDLEQAEQLLTEAGYTDGLELTLETPSDSLHATFALAMATAMEGSPVTITVHQSDPATYWDKVWQNVPFMTNDWNRRAPIELMPLMFDSEAEWNDVRFDDPQFESDIELARRTQGASQDEAIASAAERVLDTSGFLCPGFRHRVFAFKKGVNEAVYDSSTSLNLTKTWLS